MTQLSSRRAAFVREYLVDLNPTQAAFRAGYRHNSKFRYGWRLLKTPEIAAAIQEAMDERAQRTEVTADRVVRELAAIAFSDIRKVVSWKALPPPPRPAPATLAAAAGEAAGEPPAPPPCPMTTYEVVIRDSGEIDPDSGAAIAQLRHYASGGAHILMHDKLGALNSLARHLGMFVNRHEVSGPDGGPVEVHEEMLDRRIRAMAPERRAALRAAIQAAVGE